MSGQHILVIDHDEVRRKRLAQSVLKPAGYSVSLAGRVQTSPARGVDLILLGASGEAPPFGQLERLTAAFPASPILLLIRGDRWDEASHHRLRKIAFDVLAAPFRPADLLDAIREGLLRRRRLVTWAARSVRRQASDFETVSQVGRSVTSTLDLDHVLTVVVKAAVEVTGAEEGSLLLLDPGTQELYMRAAYNFQDSFARTLRLPTSDSLAGGVLQSGQPLLLDQKTPEKIKTHYLVHSLIYVPLIIKDQRVGVLGVDNRINKKSFFTKRHITILTTLAGYAAVALENARLFAQAEFEREKFENMVRSVANGVIVVDDQSKTILVNEPACELLDIDPLDGEGAPFADLVELPELVACVVDPAQSSSRRIEIQPESGRHFVATIHLLPGVGKTITIQDVTHYKELDHIKNEFFQAISHDLRSPLTAILGYVELIRRVGEINEQQREFIQRIQASVSSITELINALLELGRIEAEFDLEKEGVQIPAIVHSAVGSISHRFAHKKQSLRVNLQDNVPPVYGLPIRLRQMLGNLLENASKYTPEGGEVELRVRLEGAQVIIQVEDTGIGIPAADLPFIFDKTYRASNIPLGTPGTGIGLSIVRSIVQNHGGRLWCESTPGRGSTFTIVLPAEWPA